jgi:uncharacterized membrane protein (UPF0127 family)
MNGFFNKRCGGAFLALLFLFLACGSMTARAQETFSTESLAIEKNNGDKIEFTVELALTGGQRQQGLMFRKTMSENHGMLFDFGGMRDVTMWMRNTFLPLDMIFFGPDGVITHIHENAVPHSESIISSRGPVKYVLEVNGGLTRKLGIRPGDRASSAQIQKAK